MHTVYVDSGTTNTRAYLLDDYRLVACRDRTVGVRDAALAGSTRPLVEALRSLWDELLTAHALSADDVRHVCVSGMASSPGGLLEVGHLDAPTSVEELRAALVPLHDPAVLPAPLWLVPGVRALPGTPPLTPEQAVDAQLMRGEETEVLGVLDGHPDDGPCVVVLPGSHTQSVVVDHDAIVDLFSTVTGELRSAVIDGTILGSALRDPAPDRLDPHFVRLGHRTLARHGVNRALYALRTLDLLGGTTADQRHAYLQGVLTGGVVDGLLQRLGRAGRDVRSLVVAGRRSEHDAYEAVAAVVAPHLTVTHADAGSTPFSVRGYRRVARDNPLLGTA